MASSRRGGERLRIEPRRSRESDSNGGIDHATGYRPLAQRDMIAQRRQTVDNVKDAITIFQDREDLVEIIKTEKELALDSRKRGSTEVYTELDKLEEKIRESREVDWDILKMVAMRNEGLAEALTNITDEISDKSVSYRRPQGSWESLLGDNWETSKKFWESGTESWSREKAVVKDITDENETEFQEMQDKEIPGRYMANDNTGDRVYIPTQGTGAWTTFIKEYNYNDAERDNIKSKIREGYTHQGWRQVNRLDRPNVKVKTPTGQNDHYISPDRPKEYFDTHFLQRDDITIAPENFRKVTNGQWSKGGGIERDTHLPYDDQILFGKASPTLVNKSYVIGTTIIWKKQQNQG